jgi:hypothetical protein
MNKLIALFILLISSNLSGQIDTLNQIVMATSGEVLQSDNYILNFTLGEVVTGNFETPNTFLAQGFHQPDSLMIVSVASINPFDGTIIIYPNPTTNLINVEVKLLQQEELEINLFDASGKRIVESRSVFGDGIIKYDVSKYPAGNYFIEITSHLNRIKQSYKIIKL